MYEGKTSGELFKKKKEKQYWTRNCLDRPEMAKRKWYWATRNTSRPVTTLQGMVAYPQQLKSTVTNSSRKFSVLSWHRFFLLVQGGKSREKVVKLLASTPPEEILEKLKKQVEKK